MTRDELKQITLQFTDAFNRDDLDGVMAWFAEDAVYDEFHGARHEGKEAIRAAFEPMFAGKFGKVRFEEEDLFLDPEDGKAMISWSCCRVDRLIQQFFSRSTTEGDGICRS